MLYLTETKRHGVIATGYVLFTSETNNVDVRFRSDYTVRYSGFSLDIRSTLYSDLGNSHEDEDCDDPAHDPVIATGEVLQGDLVTNSDNLGKYQTDACQNWNIMTDENQVYASSSQYQIYYCHRASWGAKYQYQTRRLMYQRLLELLYCLFIQLKNLLPINQIYHI